MILVIDNYDSFTYNLVQYIGEFYPNVLVKRNDAIQVSDITKLNVDKIVISPGPGRPSNAGISMDVIRAFYQTIPILGVCLGHQAIGEVFGGTITYASQIMHGKTSLVNHNETGIYQGIPNPFHATRYHSLMIDPNGFPHQDLAITATLPDDTIMGIQHHHYPLIGIQYHPESILTTHGKAIIQNFLNI